ncbi:hypothetical protein CALCODRAFT_435724, partial [Calocera cornea HHB12733]
MRDLGDLGSYQDLQVRDRPSPTFTNAVQLKRLLDKHLPPASRFQVTQIEVEGGSARDSETLELWGRDPLDCIRELLGDPLLDGYIDYTPRRDYIDEARTKRLYSEYATGDHMWSTQASCMPDGATLAAVILASDKTQLSMFRGDKSAWPVYLSLANIHKEVRRKPSERAMVLLGYLPASKLQLDLSDAERSIRQHEIFHHCLSTLLQPMHQATEEGAVMVCGDGFKRRIHPVLVSYIADHPEQCMIVTCRQNRCPRCTIEPDDRGAPIVGSTRDPHRILQIGVNSQDERSFRRELKSMGLLPISHPFWSDLLISNIFDSMTPDLLHELHKGLFKDHLVKWTMDVLDAKRLDQRYISLCPHHGLLAFPHGISKVEQWTGTEYKNMEKTFCAAIAGLVPSAVYRAARGLIDFIYLSQLPEHSDRTLSLLDASWQEFHSFKDVFRDLPSCHGFNFPKMHKANHNAEAIRSRGTLDGYSTELPEHLHKTEAKKIYRAGNKKDPFRHMAKVLRRDAALEKFARYLHW